MRTVLPKNFNPIPPQAKRVFKGVIYEVYQWQQEMFDGSSETFEMLKRSDIVKVIAVKEDRIAIVKETQPQIGFFIDIPGGRNDNDSETELEAAQRELREETGLVCARWKLLQVEQAHKKIDCVFYTFLASEVIQTVPLELDAGEKIEVEWLTLEEVKELITDSRVRYLPKEILDRVKTIEELLQLPEITA